MSTPLFVAPLFVVVVLGMALALTSINKIKEDSASQRHEARFPYELSKHFLSPTELSFYHVLRKAVPGENTVLTKVRIADVLGVVKGTEKRQTHFNKISAKHIDFLICDNTTLIPIFAVELDDSSHARAKQLERDKFVNHAFDAAGLPLFRIRARKGYVVEELRSEFSSVL